MPAQAAFDRAVSKLRRGELERICEFNPCAPIYLIPTAPFLRALARRLGRRRVVEVAAGDGFLASELANLGVRIIATDSGKWEKPQARMNAKERRRYRNVKGLSLGVNVVRIGAIEAIRKYRPDVVLASWLPPGPLLGKVIRASKEVIEIGAGSGVTGNIRCWRYPHDFLEELDALGRCRLDERPAQKLHTHVTRYFTSSQAPPEAPSSRLWPPSRPSRRRRPARKSRR